MTIEGTLPPLYTFRSNIINTGAVTNGLAIQGNPSRLCFTVSWNMAATFVGISPNANVMTQGGIWLRVEAEPHLIHRHQYGDLIGLPWYWFCTAGASDIHFFETVRASM